MIDKPETTCISKDMDTRRKAVKFYEDFVSAMRKFDLLSQEIPENVVMIAHLHDGGNVIGLAHVYSIEFYWHLCDLVLVYGSENDNLVRLHRVLKNRYDFLFKSLSRVECNHVPDKIHSKTISIPLFPEKNPVRGHFSFQYREVI